MKRSLAAAAILLLAAACSGPAGTPAIQQAEIEAAAASIVSYPLSLDPTCRDGRAIAYDQCSNQMDLYTAAVDRLGLARVVDLVGVLGYYTLISMTINAFEVPVPPGAPEPFAEER